MAFREMVLTKLFLFSLFLNISLCDWASEWMAPVQDQLINTDSPQLRGSNFDERIFDEDNEHVTPGGDYDNYQIPNRAEPLGPKYDLTATSLKMKLESTLHTAQKLADSLKTQIDVLTAKEMQLKEAIANGMTGVTTVTVSSLGQLPRSYFIRDGYWTRCNGILQQPSVEQAKNFFNEMFSTPRCIGQELSSGPDPCVFNSIIKYETIPTYRRAEYYEEDYLCLKPFFNSSMEQYLSVPKQMVNDTCKQGIVRSLAENSIECGIRTMAEYTYFPKKSYASHVPLEYCAEKDGTCKMVVAWHVSNATIENFVFLKNQPSFKKYFIKSNYAEQVI